MASDRSEIPDLKDIGPDTPLRLETALKIAFPDGGMSVQGFRQELKRYGVVIERYANKDYVTLRSIWEMRRKCRAKAGGHISGSEESGMTVGQLHGSSATALTDAERKAARDSALMRLSKSEAPRSPNISPENTTPGRKADVIQMKH